MLTVIIRHASARRRKAFTPGLCYILCLRMNDQMGSWLLPAGFWSDHPSPSPLCVGCREGHVDLVLLVDGSKSVRPQNFELVKRFVNQIVDFLDVSPEGTRVGLVQFSSRVRTEFPLGRYGTAAEVKQAVLAVEYMERGTMTGMALRHMVEHSFSEAQGARPRVLNVPRVGLVFTDGRSQDDISVWAARAKEEGGLSAGRTGVGLGWTPGGGFP